MAKEYTIEIVGQPTRYSHETRKFNMYFAEPETGANEETGILLFLAGYGGHAMSKVYQKMRRTFADQYNLITLQCDYLGTEFMQDDQHMPITEELIQKNFTQNDLQRILERKERKEDRFKDEVITGYVPMKEDRDNFNEMGLWQAMDNLMAIQVLLDIMKENGLGHPKNGIIMYGQSHGAYLAYLCNFLAPDLFSLLIDNSGYLFPYYIEHDRAVTKVGEKITLQKVHHYMVSDMKIDRECYDLRKLYRGFKNKAQIIVYHGADDTMIPLEEKRAFLNEINQVHLHVVTREMTQEGVFSSSSHSLGADLLELFQISRKEWSSFSERKNISRKEQQRNKTFCTKKFCYEVDWSKGIPILQWKSVL